MKKIALIACLFALSFATGFTCSKNAPEQTSSTTSTTTTTTESPAAQAQMEVSGDATVAQPATPTATETK